MENTTRLRYLLACAAVLIGLGLLGAVCPVSAQPKEGVRRPLSEQGVAFAMRALTAELSGFLEGRVAPSKDFDPLGLLGLSARVTSKGLAEEFDANEIAAIRRFKGKRFALTGPILGGRADAFGNGYL